MVLNLSYHVNRGGTSIGLKWLIVIHRLKKVVMDIKDSDRGVSSTLYNSVWDPYSKVSIHEVFCVRKIRDSYND